MRRTLFRGSAHDHDNDCKWCIGYASSIEYDRALGALYELTGTYAATGRLVGISGAGVKMHVERAKERADIKYDPKTLYLI